MLLFLFSIDLLFSFARFILLLFSFVYSTIHSFNDVRLKMKNRISYFFPISSHHVAENKNNFKKPDTDV